MAELDLGPFWEVDHYEVESSEEGDVYLLIRLKPPGPPPAFYLPISPKDALSLADALREKANEAG